MRTNPSLYVPLKVLQSRTPKRVPIGASICCTFDRNLEAAVSGHLLENEQAEGCIHKNADGDM